MTHACAVPDCGRQVRLEMLMCRDHWYQVPLAAQRQVWATYRRRGQSHDADEAYEDAVQEAIAAVVKR